MLRFNIKYPVCVAWLLVFSFLIGACNPKPAGPPAPDATAQPIIPQSSPTPSPTPTPPPPRQLNICMPREPGSLFLYGDTSLAARSIREAIYDGPIDQRSYSPVPVILEKLPSLADGSVGLQPVQVLPNDLIVDSLGNLTNLVEGVTFFPSGCSALACAQAYSGQEPVSMDQMVIRYQLRPGLLWSDGSPLTADDSLYSYEVARSLGSRGRPELIDRTQSYQALDPQTTEWRGVPGWREPDVAEYFFTPLPRQIMGGIDASEITAQLSPTQAGTGWGAYTLGEWIPGEKLTLKRNANYFQGAAGLPRFDSLVFYFIPDRVAALAALESGQCDLLDPAYGFSPQDVELQQAQQAGKAAFKEIPAIAWEHLDFGINAAQSGGPRPAFFQSKEIRQAIAQCIDRQKLVDEFVPGGAVLNNYLPPDHPLYNSQAQQIPFDPLAANARLQAAGWIDTDNNPATPRVALGAPGIADGTPFVVTLQTSDEPERQRLAGRIAESLAQCGIQVELASGPAEQVFAPGPDGSVFGRKFDLAQFAWPVSAMPACDLFMTRSIPGPYPQSPQGWGGANASGFSNPQFDQACQAALSSLPGQADYQAAHEQAQAVFADELPALPLFLRPAWVVTRTDFCGLEIEPANLDVYWNIENFDTGDGCAAQ